MTLNIIGNGFDLYHGLPCSYYYFGCFLLSKYSDFYNELSEMYGFSSGVRIGYEEYEYAIDDIYWNCFEESLGELDSTWVLEKLDDDLGLECPDPIDLNMYQSHNSQHLKKYFNEWVESTLDLIVNYRIIRKMLKDDKLNFGHQDYFINFNYTHVLENVYKIPQSCVYHIHGESGIGDSLIVGHGNESEIESLKNTIKELEDSPEYYGEQSTRNRYNEYVCEWNNLEDLHKDVKSIINEMQSHLKIRKLDVIQIKVWGLSCGKVDLPYIKKLKELYPKASWKFSYYNNDELELRKKIVEELGITDASFFCLCGTYSDDIKQRIIEENGIELYNNISDYDFL